MKGSKALVKMLNEYGVKYIFGLCGDTSIDLYDALSENNHDIKHILTRDERSASYMADAYARISGKPGICEGPSGGGALFIIAGVAEANGSTIPLISLNTDITISHQDKGTLTELNQKELFASVTKWSEKVLDTSLLPSAIREAFKNATGGVPGAVHLCLPMDVLKGNVKLHDIYIDPAYRKCPASRQEPEGAAIEKAADLILDSSFPFIIAGGGVHISGAYEELNELVQMAGIPISTSITGKGSISEIDPYAVGVIGSNGGLKFRHDILSKADLIIFLGMRGSSVTMDGWRLLENRKKKVIHIDINPDMIGLNYFADVGIVGDAKVSLNKLNEVLRSRIKDKKIRKVPKKFLLESKRQHMEKLQYLFRSSDIPTKPERIINELQKAVPKEAIYVVDPGTPCPYLSGYIELSTAGRHFITPRAHGALGYVIPGVVGAHYANPEAKIVGVMGDGSFAMAAGELETIYRLSIPATLIVINNASYGWIKAGQKASKSPFFSTDFTQSDHADIAEAYGIKALRVEDPKFLRDALKEALNFNGPFLLDILTQPLEEAKAPVSKWVV